VGITHVDWLVVRAIPTNWLTVKVTVIDWLMVKNTLINLSVVKITLIDMLPAVTLSTLVEKTTLPPSVC